MANKKKVQDTQKDEARQRLRDAIAMKAAQRSGVAVKNIRNAQDLLSRLRKDVRVTEEMINLYIEAGTAFPKMTVPDPLEILNNQDKYKQDHMALLANLMEKAKAGLISMEEVPNLLNNAYTRYMTRVLGISLNPFQN